MLLKLRITLIVLLLFTGAVSAEKKATFSNLLKPESIQVYEDELFINEGPTIFIYSLKDYRLKKKFGKQGEGPKEFKLSSLGLEGHKISFRIFPGSIFVSSEKKVSYFSRKGEFIKENRVYEPLVLDLTPIGEHFVGRNYKAIENIPYFSVDLYDKEGKKIKEICKHPIPYYRKENMVLWQLVAKLPESKTNGRRIFVAGSGDNIIDIYNSKGERIKVINQEFPKYKKRKITGPERKEILEVWKRDYPFIKRRWSVFKNMIDVPGYFPALRTFWIADKTIYVQTCNILDGKTRFVIFDVNGKFIRQVFLPLRYRNIIKYFPYTIDKHLLYQLVENEDADAWELHVTKIR